MKIWTIGIRDWYSIRMTRSILNGTMIFNRNQLDKLLDEEFNKFL